MPENLWERAKATLALAADAISIECPDISNTEGEYVADVLNALLAEMERVECVEGARMATALPDGYAFVRDATVGRPALLLLLPETVP